MIHHIQLPPDQLLKFNTEASFCSTVVAYDSRLLCLGCFCKDQVYLTGILQILQVRHSLDFHLLCCMGKVSYEDIEMLRPHFNSERTKIPSFMQDVAAYRERLDFIVEVNGLEVWLEQSAKEKEGGDEIYEEK